MLEAGREMDKRHMSRERARDLPAKNTQTSIDDARTQQTKTSCLGSDDFQRISKNWRKQVPLTVSNGCETDIDLWLMLP
jgi:hypothetical protein